MYMKPVLASVVAMALDKWYIGERNMNSTLYFGSAMLVGGVIGQTLAPSLEVLPDLPSINEKLYDGNTLARRVEENVASLGSVYVLNKYILGNDIYINEVGKRVGVIVASQVASEYMYEYINSKPLEYLTNE